MSLCLVVCLCHFQSTFVKSDYNLLTNGNRDCERPEPDLHGDWTPPSCPIFGGSDWGGVASLQWLFRRICFCWVNRTICDCQRTRNGRERVPRPHHQRQLAWPSHRRMIRGESLFLLNVKMIDCVERTNAQERRTRQGWSLPQIERRGTAPECARGVNSIILLLFYLFTSIQFLLCPGWGGRRVCAFWCCHNRLSDDCNSSFFLLLYMVFWLHRSVVLSLVGIRRSQVSCLFFWIRKSSRIPGRVLFII